MKKWIVAALLFGSVAAYAGDATRSSWTVTTEKGILSQNPGDIFTGIVIGQRSATAETLSVWDATNTVNGVVWSTITVIDCSTGTSTAGRPGTDVYYFDVRISSGITYKKSGGNSSVTILWNKKK